MGKGRRFSTFHGPSAVGLIFCNEPSLPFALEIAFWVCIKTLDRNTWTTPKASGLPFTRDIWSFSLVTEWPHSVGQSSLELLLLRQTGFILGLLGSFSAFTDSLPYLGLWWRMYGITVSNGNRKSGNDPTHFSSSFRSRFHDAATFSLPSIKSSGFTTVSHSQFVPWLTPTFPWALLPFMQFCGNWLTFY